MSQKQAYTDPAATPLTSAELTALLVRVADHQDKAAFGDLFTHFAPRVKSYVLKLGCSDTMAEDLAQQTLIQVWRKAKLFDASKAAASTWIFRIARNLRIDVLRKDTHYHYDDYDFSTMADDSDSAEEHVSRDQTGDMMRKALSRLPQDQSEVIHLSFYDGLSHGEIATKLDLPLGTVKSRMRLAFTKLRETIDVANRVLEGGKA
ncbi:sigma-70 family RNA polymerase sigma factor [Magnetovibrio sp. PR-2]|uniref:sigma-70 family RNA polymerase sigma factor n=1 Tax=Magnetovibrio sp. PR-2 TaxID=3120356 RepID=UPI002FCE64E7